MLQPFIRIELVWHPPPGELLIQQDTLVERHQFVLHAVKQAQWWQALQMVEHRILVLWDKNHNCDAL